MANYSLRVWNKIQIKSAITTNIYFFRLRNKTRIIKMELITKNTSYYLIFKDLKKLRLIWEGHSWRW
jgi:hypothetical protein